MTTSDEQPDKGAADDARNGPSFKTQPSAPRLGAYQQRTHRWGKAIAGQGRSRVCVACGEREAVAAGTVCRADAPTRPGRAESEYDPLA